MKIFSFLSAILLLTACTGPSEQVRIEQAIQGANYCDTANDCTVLTGKCPFGCYVLVHNAEAEEIDALMQSFESTCTYSCIQAQPVVCEQNTCVMQEMEPNGNMNGGLPQGSFEFNESGNFYGELYLRGYAATEIVDEAFCEEDCEQFEYVYFVPTEIGNSDFEDFLERNHGNSYVDAPSIGLGCLENGTIQYENHSDERGFIQQILDAETTNQLMSASQGDPIVLKLTNLELTGGRGAPTCYSHFTEVELYTSGAAVDAHAS